MFYKDLDTNAEITFIVIGKILKQSKCLSTGEQIKKLWCSHIKHSLAVKRNNLATT